MTRMLDAFNNCIDKAKESNGVGGNGYRLAACVFDSKMYFSLATNSLKTHPLMLKFSNYPYLHAEVHACIKAGLDNCKDKDLIIVRLKKDNSLAMSKPCPSCEKFLRFAMIKRVFFTNEKGKIECLSL